MYKPHQADTSIVISTEDVKQFTESADQVPVEWNQMPVRTCS